MTIVVSARGNEQDFIEQVMSELHYILAFTFQNTDTKLEMNQRKNAYKIWMGNLKITNKKFFYNFINFRLFVQSGFYYINSLAAVPPL